MFINQRLDDKILTLTINRPERLNAIGPAIASELLSKLTELKTKLTQETSDIGCLCLRASAVQRSTQTIWIAGGDLRELGKLSRRRVQTFFSDMNQVCDLIESLPLPVIAVIDGAAIGGGAELALACDWRIGSCQASLDFKQLTIGLPTGFGGASRLMRSVGLTQAQKILYGQKLIKAKRAYKLGLFHELISDPKALEKAVTERAQAISSIAVEAFTAQKKILLDANANHQHSEVAQKAMMHAWGNSYHKHFIETFFKRDP